MTKPKLISLVLLLWLIASTAYAYYYVVTILALPEAYDAYARNWQFQLLMFSLVRLPWLVLALAVPIGLIIARPKRGTRMRILLFLIANIFLGAAVHGQEPDQPTKTGNQITREQKLAPGREAPTVIYASMPAYPAIAAARKVNGAVLIDVDIDPTGNVIEARPIMGDKLLRELARKAAFVWRFNASSESGVRSVRLTFIYHDSSYVAPEKKPQFTSPYQLEVEWTGTP